MTFDKKYLTELAEHCKKISKIPNGETCEIFDGWLLAVKGENYVFLQKITPEGVGYKAKWYNDFSEFCNVCIIDPYKLDRGGDHCNGYFMKICWERANLAVPREQ